MSKSNMQKKRQNKKQVNHLTTSTIRSSRCTQIDSRWIKTSSQSIALAVPNRSETILELECEPSWRDILAHQKSNLYFKLIGDLNRSGPGLYAMCWTRKTNQGGQQSLATTTILLRSRIEVLGIPTSCDMLLERLDSRVEITVEGDSKRALSCIRAKVLHHSYGIINMVSLEKKSPIKSTKANTKQQIQSSISSSTLSSIYRQVLRITTSGDMLAADFCLWIDIARHCDLDGLFGGVTSELLCNLCVRKG
jgi:hypothetical protein